MINPAQVKEALAGRMLDVCLHLFPSGRKSGGQFFIGNIAGEPGKSLSIIIEGEKAGTWCDFAEGTKGGPLDLWMQARNLSFRGALREAAQWAGIINGDSGNGSTPAPRRVSTNQHKPVPTGPKLPADASPGTEADWRELAALRHVSVESICAATHLGTLLFGSVGGFRCWILTDARGLIAEARRMDGRLFPEIESLRERKAHTLKGSVKSWPVGLMLKAFAPEPDAPFLVVEGGADYLAALHFLMEDKPEGLRCHPVTFLGAGTASAIHPEAIQAFAGKRARIYAHADNAGREGAERWAAQLSTVSADVDIADFTGLRKADGSLVKDLNDITQIHPEDAHELKGLLPD